MASFGNVDTREIDRFNKISLAWWDLDGEMRTLHMINPLRVEFIMGKNAFHHPRILDVGCGGGILSEALAKAGASVTGIDLSPASIAAARRHALSQGVKVDYRCIDVDQYTQQNAECFDIVTCMEMLEHVPDPEKIIGACSHALKPGGQAYFSTINRTLKALLFVILIGENVLHLLPRGSHKYSRLIRPYELSDWAAKYNLEFVRLSSLIYNPFTGKFKPIADKEDVNYMVQFIN